jgi:hypothetical protein
LASARLPTQRVNPTLSCSWFSPLLALPLVIDHNTKPGAEFPGLLHPCGESMQATDFRITAERIVGNSEPLQVEVFGGFFGHRRGAGGRPRVGMPRHKPC